MPSFGKHVSRCSSLEAVTLDGCLITMSTSIADSTLPPYIVEFLKREFGEEIIKHGRVQEVKSAQQQVWILSDVPSSEAWNNAIDVGNHRLVARRWKGASRWWNLNNHHPDEVCAVALAELAGYRLAHTALASQNTLHIPELLHSAFNDASPWAIFTYVGPFSSYFTKSKLPDSFWIDSMVKYRQEFGFEESHPRWGRVPSERALEYATELLSTVTIPLHRYINKHRDVLDWSSLCKDTEGITFQDMVSFYKCAQERMMGNPQDVAKATMLVHVLSECIEKLRLESLSVHRIPHVLCHMDCQPQNLVFFKEERDSPKIMSVLDWEDAAYADPRFELLLLARKVCANREQAETLWKAYQDKLMVDLGNIEPWLKLETVHSLSTLILQRMNLLGGGRNPWETIPDLDQKIRREFARLVFMGWEFCKDVATEH